MSELQGKFQKAICLGTHGEDYGSWMSNPVFYFLMKEGSNLTRRYPREKTVERIAYIKGLRDQKQTIPQIKEILQEKDNIV